jgi:GDP-D-mannose 3', 5'-epimerase
MEVAVTGGAGFIGSHVAKRLMDEGYSVRVIDDFSTGSELNLRDLGVKSKVVRGDLRDRSFAEDSLKGCDVVYHFAAEVGSVQFLHGSIDRELYALQTNLLIDTNVFRACVQNGVKSVIYASSVSVYPKHLQMTSSAPFREQDSEKTVDPEGGYGWSKLVAEKQLEMMSKVNVGVARIFHAYGKNIYIEESKSQVIGSLLRKAIRYPVEDFVVWGDGTQRRCFVHIDDVLRALSKMYSFISEGNSLTVNVGSEDEITVGELARKVIALSGKTIPLKFDTSRPTGVRQRVPSLEKIENTLNWRPEISFSTGLEETYRWAEERLMT